MSLDGTGYGDVVASATKGDLRLRIIREEYPEDPRREIDNLGTMVCWHRRYRLGDKHDFRSPEDFRRRITSRNAIILPLYLLDHSVLVLSTDPEQFRACDPHGWDWGQVGWIYVTKDRVRREYKSRITPDIRKKVEDVLRVEIDEYNDYLSGNVFGYVVEQRTQCPTCRHEEWKLVNSCFGFYGHPEKSGMKECLAKEEYVPLFEEALKNLI